MNTSELDLRIIGQAERTAGLDLLVIPAEYETGVADADYQPDCNNTLENALRRFRNDLGAAVTAAQQEILAASGPLNDAVAGVADMMSDLNSILMESQQDETRGLAALTSHLDMLAHDAAESDQLTRLADHYGLVIIDGITFPAGAVDLLPFARLYGYLGGTVPAMQSAIQAAAGSFIFITTRMAATVDEVYDSCNGPVPRVTLTETVVGVDISIADAARRAGCTEDEIELRVFWVDEFSASRANMLRLRAFGVVGADMQTVLTRQTSTRVETYILNSSLIPTLLGAGCSHAGIADCLDRTTASTPHIDPSPTLAAVQSAINRALTLGPAPTTQGGRGNDAAASLLLNNLDFGKTFGVGGPAPDPAAEPNDGCRSVVAALDSAVRAVAGVMSFVRSILGRQFISVGLGAGLTNEALGLTNCIVSFKLGLGLSFNITLGLPGKFKLLNRVIGIAISAMLRVIDAVNMVLCFPSALISGIYGGICGLAPLNGGSCSPELETMVEKVRVMVGMARNIVVDIGTILGDTKLAWNAAAGASADLNVQAVCQSKVVGLLVVAAGVIGAATRGGFDQLGNRIVSGVEAVGSSVNNQIGAIRTSVIGEPSQVKR